MLDSLFRILKKSQTSEEVLANNYDLKSFYIKTIKDMDCEDIFIKFNINQDEFTCSISKMNDEKEEVGTKHCIIFDNNANDDILNLIEYLYQDNERIEYIEKVDIARFDNDNKSKLLIEVEYNDLNKNYLYMIELNANSYIINNYENSINVMMGNDTKTLTKKLHL
ncbi:MAG: hypothetical protein IJ574_05480 [Bacilli bacterium]|nr:hypothetical protein [Bacilli bacterium]